MGFLHEPAQIFTCDFSKRFGKTETFWYCSTSKNSVTETSTTAMENMINFILNKHNQKLISMLENHKIYGGFLKILIFRVPLSRTHLQSKTFFELLKIASGFSRGHKWQQSYLRLTDNSIEGMLTRFEKYEKHEKLNTNFPRTFHSSRNFACYDNLLVFVTAFLQFTWEFDISNLSKQITLEIASRLLRLT